MKTKQEIIKRIREIDVILAHYEEQDNSILGVINNRLIALIDGGYSQNESYYHKRRLEEEKSKLQKKLIEIENNPNLEKVFNKLSILVKLNKITESEFERFKDALKTGKTTIEKINNVIDSFNINFESINKENALNQNNEYDLKLLRMIAIFVKLSQKKGEIFLPRDKLYFKDIIKTRFNVSDLSIIDELFKLDIKDIEPLIFLEEMYEIFPKELSETIRELTKLDVKSDILDSDLVKELRLKLTKLKQKEIK
jgi:hypothetical protein